MLVDQGEDNNVKHLFGLHGYCVLATIPPYAGCAEEAAQALSANPDSHDAHGPE
jgi:hypothetical protein